MPDALFSVPRLAAIYDAVDGERNDLDAYVSIATELGARSVLDVGCGTGTLACLLADRGLSVTGVDPAEASVQIARSKPGSDRVRFIVGEAAAALPIEVDLVTMTGNAAQVFLDDDEWASFLGVARSALKAGGHLVFETRDPAMKAWERWTPEETTRSLELPGAGRVLVTTTVTGVELPYVSFCSSFTFEDDGVTLTSLSTLRFRTREEIESGLAKAGFGLESVRDAPDRPGLELVFVAERL